MDFRGGLKSVPEIWVFEIGGRADHTFKVLWHSEGIFSKQKLLTTHSKIGFQHIL